MIASEGAWMDFGSDDYHSQRKRRLTLYLGFVAALCAASAVAGVAAGGDAAGKVLAGGSLLPVYVWMWSTMAASKFRVSNLRRGLRTVGELAGTAGAALFVVRMEIWLIGAPFWPDGSTPLPVAMALIGGMLLCGAGLAILAVARVLHELFWFR
jgi:hypothetical protein